MITARITTKGQITVPKEVRQRLRVEPGDALEFEFHGERLEVRPVKRRRIEEFYGMFAGSSALGWEEARQRAWLSATKRLAEGGSHDAV